VYHFTAGLRSEEYSTAKMPEVHAKIIYICKRFLEEVWGRKEKYTTRSDTIQDHGHQITEMTPEDVL
jgi:hypothetical protein